MIPSNLGPLPLPLFKLSVNLFHTLEDRIYVSGKFIDITLESDVQCDNCETYCSNKYYYGDPYYNYEGHTEAPYQNYEGETMNGVTYTKR